MSEAPDPNPFEQATTEEMAYMRELSGKLLTLILESPPADPAMTQAYETFLNVEERRFGLINDELDRRGKTNVQ